MKPFTKLFNQGLAPHSKLYTQGVSPFNLICSRSKRTKPGLSVTLLATVPGLGREGDIVTVKAGRMRNDLYPQKLAQYNIKELNQFCRKEVEIEKAKNRNRSTSSAHTQTKDTDYANYMKLASHELKLKDVPTLKFFRAVVEGQEGSEQLLYGSVSLDDVLKTLREQYQLPLEKDNLTMEKVKRVGIYQAVVDLGPIGRRSLNIEVMSLDQEIEKTL